MTRTTSLRRLAFVLILAACEAALKALAKVSDRERQTPDDAWQREPSKGHRR